MINAVRCLNHDPQNKYIKYKYSISVSAPTTAETTTPTVDVDSSKPVTKLRIRLASGKQVVQGNVLQTKSY